MMQWLPRFFIKWRSCGVRCADVSGHAPFGGMTGDAQCLRVADARRRGWAFGAVRCRVSLLRIAEAIPVETASAASSVAGACGANSLGLNAEALRVSVFRGERWGAGLSLTLTAHLGRAPLTTCLATG
ncbi:hypothetical protein AAFF_G00131480 [Aldrovandia affinis]|uniref:Uncharacterized protein n=1 Tax=Aldrovandia affinis TaxID=143900 RepID=A0AAD7RQJ5_9TELE|nr:hypothetical protein AAFF_G00131480 [Aldrovandia affinis]